MRVAAVTSPRQPLVVDQSSDPDGAIARPVRRCRCEGAEEEVEAEQPLAGEVAAELRHVGGGDPVAVLEDRSTQSSPGFVAATIVLHLAGMGAGLGLARLPALRAGAGVLVASTGVLVLVAL